MNESYVTLDEADAYHAARVSATSWSLLGETERKQRLMAASDYIDAAYRFRYRKTDPNQLRQFPRNGMTTIPPEVKQAVMELANNSALLNKGIASSKAQARSRVKVGELEVQYSDSSSVSGSLTDFWLIDRLLADWIIDPNRKWGAIMVGNAFCGCE